MSKVNRRKFITAGAGIAAITGIGYLTKDYWLSYPESTQTSSSTSTPTTNQSQQPTVAETTTPTPTETTTFTPTETTTTTETMSEDEIKIRELLDTWIEAYNSENVMELMNLYTLDATIDFGCISKVMSVTKVEGYKNILQLYTWLAAKRDLRVLSYKIAEIEIENDSAEVLSRFTLHSVAKNVSWVHKLELYKINEIKRGSTKFKLDKPLWKIYKEYSHCAMDG